MKPPTPIVASAQPAYSSERACVEDLNNHYRLMENHGRASFQEKLKVGEILLYVRKKIPHGRWMAWLEKNFQGSYLNAARAMAAARNFGKKNPGTMTLEQLEDANQICHFDKFEDAESTETVTTSERTPEENPKNLDRQSATSEGENNPPDDDVPIPEQGGPGDANEGPPVTRADREEESRQRVARRAAASDVVDPHGTPVPNRCKDAWSDPWVDETVTLLHGIAADFRARRLADGLDKRKKYYPFFKPQDFIDGVGMIDSLLDQLTEHLEQNKPAAVCPACKGQGCAGCRMSGLVPAPVYEQLKGGA